MSRPESSFRRDERYCLTKQLRCAALSVPANIVEGTARSHHAEILQFLRVAWGSLQEAGYYIHVAQRLGYISEALAAELQDQVHGVAAPLIGLMRHYKR